MFYRTLEFMKDGVNLIFVLDGLPPEIKHEKLKKQREKLTFNMNLDAHSSNRPYLERYSAEVSLYFYFYTPTCMGKC